MKLHQQNCIVFLLKTFVSPGSQDNGIKTKRTIKIMHQQLNIDTEIFIIVLFLIVFVYVRQHIHITLVFFLLRHSDSRIDDIDYVVFRLKSNEQVYRVLCFFEFF
jgi:hypothetical protein